MTETARAALLCAAESIPVFPCALDKKPLTPHGFKDATCDEATVRAWWKKYPDASVGIPTGAASGWFVVDVDPKSGGSESLAMLCEEFGEEWLDTLTQQTGSLGYHFIFEHDAGLNLRNSASKVAPGIDTRGEGGYIIFAPSPHPSGRRYCLINTREPQKPPEWLVEKLTAPVERRAPSGSTSNRTSRASFCEGGRNAKLFAIGCAMLARGELSEKIEAELFAVNAQSCKPPLDDAEVWKIVGSVTSGRYVVTVSEAAQ